MFENRFDECTLWIWRKMLSQPDRYWHLPDFSLGYLASRTSRTGDYERDPTLWNDRRGKQILADLADAGWATKDVAGDGYRLTESGVGSLTQLIRTGGRERGLIGTFLWEGGTAAHQVYRSRRGRRVLPASSRASELDADFDLTETHGFWWTLPRHGIAAAIAAHVQRRALRSRRSPPWP